RLRVSCQPFPALPPLFVLLMLPRPPSSTLFPYTTLFRSDYMLDRFAWLIEGLVVLPERMRANLDASHGLFFSQRVLLALVDSGLDRKSTRLNSSHVSISYAVFCLKKKTTMSSTTARLRSA